MTGAGACALCGQMDGHSARCSVTRHGVDEESYRMPSAQSETRCPTCGQSVRVITDAEGTSYYSNEAECEALDLRAGLQWVRGMCSDGEPVELIDAKLGEILNGAAPDQIQPDMEDDRMPDPEHPLIEWHQRAKRAEAEVEQLTRGYGIQLAKRREAEAEVQRLRVALSRVLSPDAIREIERAADA